MNQTRSSLLILCIGSILIVLIAGALTLRSNYKMPSWQEQYDLGIRYLNEGNYEEAILAFEAAIQIDPKNPAAYMGAAEAYVEVGDPEKALEILQQGYEKTQDETLLDAIENQPDIEEGYPKIERIDFEDGGYILEEYDRYGRLVSGEVYASENERSYRITYA